MLAVFLMNQASSMWGKKWKASVIWVLRNGPLRFSEVKKQLQGISVKVLSEVLKDLEDANLIVRKQYNTIPVKVTYELHKDTVPLIEAQVIYVKCLITYFYNRRSQFKLPTWIIEELEQEIQVSKK